MLPFFDKYPFSNFEEINLDWLMREVFSLKSKFDNIEIYQKITFRGDWSIENAYPQWSIVNDTATGNGYLSIKAVPYGIELTNTEYWVKVANYDALYSAFEDRITTLENDVDNIENNIETIENDLLPAINLHVNNNIINMSFNNTYIESELQDYIDNASDGDILIFPKNDNFSMLTGVDINKSITIDLNGSVITCQSGDIFKCHAELVTTHYVTINTTNGVITLDSVADVNVGMLARVEGSANYEMSRNYYKCGGVGIVEKINGNTIQLSNDFPTQTINATSKIEFFNAISVTIKNGTVNSLAEGSCATAIYYKNNINSIVDGVKFNNSQINIRITGSINTYVNNVKIYGGKSLSTYDWSGYGIMIDEDLNTTIENAIIFSGQHGISIGGFLPSYNNKIENVVVASEFGYVGLDCHQTNYSLSIKNVMSQGFSFAGNCIIENSQSINIRGDANLYGVGLFGNSEIYDRASFVFKNFKCYTGRINTSYDNTDYQSLKMYQISFENCYASEGWAISNGLDMVLEVSLKNCVGDGYAIFGHARSLLIENSQITADLTIANLNRMATIVNSIFNNVTISATSAYVTMLSSRFDGTTTASITALYCTLIGCVFAHALNKTVTRAGYLNSYDTNGAIS